ncbi:hypothetical protein RvY_06776 [Ramazzottius varieornatus]|uniref:Uncharacterized protein n=1 Tax=Ramazzottius varieornatus TaxID=947166 RepID=A0A1D1UZS3_RAMVA|nr:hypothetical protein RvY_06776 [Ramazzottius varieornatus]
MTLIPRSGLIRIAENGTHLPNREKGDGSKTEQIVKETSIAGCWKDDEEELARRVRRDVQAESMLSVSLDRIEHYNAGCTWLCDRQCTLYPSPLGLKRKKPKSCTDYQ